MTIDMDGIRPKVFLAYARTDKGLAHALSNELKRAGYEVWDNQDIEPGSDWAEGVEKALQRCDSMIAILTEHSFSSSYVREELQHAFFDERYKNRLLPVLIGGDSDSTFSRLPWVLTKFHVLRVPAVKSPESLAKKITKTFTSVITPNWGNAT